MKILYFVDAIEYPWAGTEGQLLKLIEGMIDSGVEVELLLLRSSDFVSSNRLPCKYTIIQVNSLASPLTFLKYISIIQFLRKHRFDLVHTFFNDVSLIAPIICYFSKVPLIISRRDMGFWYTPARIFLLRKMQRLITAYIVNSKAVARVTMDCEYASPSKIHTIYNGIYSDQAPTFLKECSCVDLVLVANYRPLKRVEDLVIAFRKLLKNSDQDLRLHLIGSGLKEAMKEHIGDSDINSHIIFYGLHDNPSKILEGCDIGVLCSESEGLSNSIIEYMKMGLPVVASNVGGNTELVVHSETGYLFDAGNVEELYLCLMRLVESQEKRKLFGLAGFSRVQSMFSIEKLFNNHRHVYSDILSGYQSKR